MNSNMKVNLHLCVCKRTRRINIMFYSTLDDYLVPTAHKNS